MHFLKKFFFVNNFEPNLIKNQDKNTSIIYRNYKRQNDLKCIIKIRNYCRKKRIKFYISNNIKLSLNLKLDGAYIPSFNRSYRHLSYSFKKNFDLIGSAHNIKEIKTKETQKVKSLFISSLFKKNKNYLGIRKFNIISKLTKKRVIALGGISKNNIKKLRIVNCIGFSGISFFE